LFGVPFLPHEWVAKAWWQVVGSGDPDHKAAGTSIRQFYSAKHAMRYCAKYVAKVVPTVASLDGADGIHYAEVGRWWGVWNEEDFPYAERKARPLRGKDETRLRRVFRHKVERDTGRRMRAGYPPLAMFCDANQVWGALSQLLC